MDGIERRVGTLPNTKEFEPLISVLGRIITAISMDAEKEEVLLAFDDGSRFRIGDDAQCCCESRYMRTDDDLPFYVGAAFHGAELRDGPDSPNGYDSHDIQFLVLQTSRGNITFSNHNEHNGYYGGFDVTVTKESA